MELENERSLLGAMLLDYDIALPAIVKHNIKDMHFIGMERTAFICIQESVCEAGYAVEPIAKRLISERTGLTLDAAHLYVDDLIGACPVSYYAEFNAGEIVRNYKTRIFSRLPNLLEMECDLSGKIRVVEDAMLEVMSESAVERKVSDIIDAIKVRWGKIHDGTQAGGVSSRFQFMRDVGGYKDLSIIAASPGEGKSTFMTNEMLYQAKQGYKVGIISLEMSDEVIVERFVADEYDVSVYGLNNGKCADGTYQEAVYRMDRLKEYDNIIQVNDKSMGISDICSAIELMRLKDKIDICYIDYLQIISNTENGMTDNSRVAMYSNRLMGLRKRLGIPIICLSQLSRDHAKKGQHPQLHDLRDSGALEQDAALVIFISTVNEGDVEPAVMEMNRNKYSGKVDLSFVNVAKNRHGPTANTILKKQFNRFRFAEMDSEGEFKVESESTVDYEMEY